MFDSFLFIGLPYVAIVSLVFGSYLRYRMRAFSYSSLSTQFLEDRWLAWGSMPWHVGIGIVLLGHILAFAFPSIWSSLVSNPVFLLSVETIGIIATILCLFGLFILLIRRFVDAKLQAVTSYLDVIALLILIFQITSGLGIAVLHRWGAAWAPGSLGPYLHSIFLLQPDVAYVQDMPPIVKLHIASAWVLLMVFPFTRLVHALAIPLHYFVRVPQKVVWNNTASQVRFEEKIATDNQRRVFLQAMVGLGASVSLLSMGALDKFLSYFSKQDLTNEQEAHLLSQKLGKLKQSAEERELELERMKKDSILVGRLSELSTAKGKYFIDYQMRPALAFRDTDGLPIVISAKCTHLGCTVSQDTDAQGRVLCPCHISYFDIRTGQPDSGSPAKSPLPHLAWALRDGKGNIFLTQDAKGRREGSLDGVDIETSMLYITKEVV